MRPIYRPSAVSPCCYRVMTRNPVRLNGYRYSLNQAAVSRATVSKCSELEYS
jgi:hypothetical protein